MSYTSATTDYDRWWSDVLSVRRSAADIFEAGPAPSAFPRLYGGQIAAQGLVAAATTVNDDREPHSVHTSFLRAGDVGHSVRYRVERTRESRTLSTRSVRAEQGDRLLAITTASFHRPPAAPRHRLEHDAVGRADDVTPPASLLTRPERLQARFGDDIPAAGAAIWPVDLRYVDRAPWDDAVNRTPVSPSNRSWLRPHGTLPKVPAAEAAALTYATDFPMFEPILFPHAIDWELLIGGGAVYGASLDHALWFHRPPMSDEWLLLSQIAPIATRSRGLCRADLRSADDGLVASVVQEVAFVEPRT